MKKIRIAIDGPSGSGKSTIAKAAAAELGYVYVDTGALYRTVGLWCKKRGVDPTDADAVAAILPDADIALRYENGAQIVTLGGESVGDAIRTPEMSMYASAVSRHPAVRAFLLGIQRKMAASGGVIMDGRDIGTVIMPDAELKLFVTVPLEIRAKWRFRELTEEKGLDVRFEDVLRDMEERDRADRERAIAPCVPAPDAIPFSNRTSVEESASEIARMACSLASSL